MQSDAIFVWLMPRAGPVCREGPMGAYVQGGITMGRIGGEK